MPYRLSAKPRRPDECRRDAYLAGVRRAGRPRQRPRLAGSARGAASLAAKEDWVYRHWLPFDEQTLKVLLGMHGRDLEAHLFDDHRTLADLVAARGLTLEEVEDALLDQWVGEVDEGRMATLRDHTRRILTQGHLAQHMFFHVYHGVDARAHALRRLVAALLAPKAAPLLGTAEFGPAPRRLLPVRREMASDKDVSAFRGLHGGACR